MAAAKPLWIDDIVARLLALGLAPMRGDPTAPWEVPRKTIETWGDADLVAAHHAAVAGQLTELGLAHIPPGSTSTTNAQAYGVPLVAHQYNFWFPPWARILCNTGNAGRLAALTVAQARTLAGAWAVGGWDALTPVWYGMRDRVPTVHLVDAHKAAKARLGR